MKASVSAGVVVTRPGPVGGEVLCVVREDGTIGIPAGQMEPSDGNPAACAKREFREEVGFEVTLKGLVKIVFAIDGTNLSIGVIFYGLPAGDILESKGELPICWVPIYRFLLYLTKDRVFKPHFNIQAVIVAARQDSARLVF